MIIAGAGGAAHLPGMLAAKTLVPVLGVPVAATQLNGTGFAALDCADAQGRSRGNAGDRQSRARPMPRCWRRKCWPRPMLRSTNGSPRGAPRAPRKCSIRSLIRSCPGELRPIRKTTGFHRSARRTARHSGRRPAGPHDGDGRAHHGLSRARDGSRSSSARRASSWTKRSWAAGTTWTRRGGWPTGADAVTLEIEQIGVDALAEVARIAPLRPGVEPIRIIQDKTLQKAWLAENGFPVGPFRVVRSEAELQEAVRALGGRVFLKIGRGGYDGRGQARIGLDQAATRRAIAAAWQSHRRACLQSPSRRSIWSAKSA